MSQIVGSDHLLHIVSLLLLLLSLLLLLLLLLVLLLLLLLLLLSRLFCKRIRFPKSYLQIL